MSLLLAIDTSTDQAGLALFDGATTAELSWPARQRHTSTIVQAIDQLLGLSERAIGDVAAVAVATGPGSFSGLRVGMSVAKGLVLARDVTVIGVPTLLVTALPHVSPDRPAVAVVGAGRKRLVWSIVRHGSPEPVAAGEPVNGSLDELVDFVGGLDGSIVVCGEVPEELRAGGRDETRIACPRLSDRRPAALARLGWDRWRRGEVDDPVTLEPAYLHLASPR